MRGQLLPKHALVLSRLEVARGQGGTEADLLDPNQPGQRGAHRRDRRIFLLAADACVEQIREEPVSATYARVVRLAHCGASCTTQAEAFLERISLSRLTGPGLRDFVAPPSRKLRFVGHAGKRAT